MKLKALPGYVLLEAIDEDTVRESGFVQPSEEKERPARGLVLDASDSKKVKKDQRVIFKRWTGTTIKEDGKELVFIEDKDVLGVYG